MGDIELSIEPTGMLPEAASRGTVRVSYPGRYDGVVVNAQIADANEHVTFVSSNGKRISKVARLFVDRESMPQGTAEFEAVISFVPSREHEVKFRASIIEQHKEIDSKIVFARYSA